MNTLQAFILGAIQGLSEFLPISSSGHLLIAEKIMGIPSENGSLLTLGILLHIGTLAAVFVVYWKRIWDMLRHPVKSELKWLIVATIPAVIAALVINFDEAFEGKFIVWSFFLTSIVLIVGDAVNAWRRKNRKVHKHMRWYHALSMGVMQAVAILPGLSRSGSTIAGGVTSGLSRRHAADFSFLMSIPAILGSAVFDMKDVFLDGQGVTLQELGAKPVLVGMASAMAFGLIAIKAFLYLIRKIGMKWFAVYTALLGCFLLVNNLYLHWIVF